MKSFFFFHGIIPPSPDGHKYVTAGPGYRVDGGTKEEHEQMTDLTGEVTRRANDEQPREVGHLAAIIHESMQKTGMAPRQR
jgi:hypothetical protein